MNIAIIPARGGSKRIPRKNIREFCGEAVIGYSIKAALNAGLFDHVIVSTDDDEIAAVAKALGAEIPFMRPADISDDFATTIDVMRHAANWAEQAYGEIDALCCIYATAPFVNEKSIRGAHQLLDQHDCEFVFPVTTFPYPIQRSLIESENGNLLMRWPEEAQTRSQDLQEAFHDAGQFYWGKTAAWKSVSNIFLADARGYQLPRHEVQDLDTEEDWVRGEIIFKMLEASR